MSLLWKKDDSEVDAEIQRFLAADDVVVDRAIFLHDVRATEAHVRGLARIGVLTADDERALCAGLGELAADFIAGRFDLDERYEDGHSAIEAFLTERVGDAGRRVHTARSRNDQVQVALRLFTRAKLDELAAIQTEIVRSFLDRAEADATTPMPGYTHLQRAVPSSVGLWLGGFAEAFLDDREIARDARRAADMSPLGTGAGFGVNVPLDREGVAADLGFARVQLNPQYVQNSRGKVELIALSALGQGLLDLRRFAWELSLFSTSE
jgi:argininosuccinate lyase